MLGSQNAGWPTCICGLRQWRPPFLEAAQGTGLQTPVGHTSIHSCLPFFTPEYSECFPGTVLSSGFQVTKRPGFVLHCSENGSSDIKVHPAHPKASITPGVFSLPHAAHTPPLLLQAKNRTKRNQKKGCWLSPLQPLAKAN